MNLRLERIAPSPFNTLSNLFIDGDFFSFLVEDPYHEEKIKGETRIPAGLYKIDLTWSPKFGKNMWEVLNVPNYSGIRFHAGSDAKDTEGCLMPAWSFTFQPDGKFRQWDSGSAYAQLYEILEMAKDRNEPIQILVTDWIIERADLILNPKNPSGWTGD